MVSLFNTESLCNKYCKVLYFVSLINDKYNNNIVYILDVLFITTISIAKVDTLPYNI